MFTKLDSIPSRLIRQRKAYGRGWLENQLASSGAQHVEDLADSIMSVLCSSRSDDELQTEVARIQREILNFSNLFFVNLAQFFDLLGFERFELIQQLLEHRSEMKKSEKSLIAQGNQVKFCLINQLLT